MKQLRKYRLEQENKLIGKVGKDIAFYGVNAIVWGSEEELRNNALVDYHPPDFIRYNVSVQMDDTIYDVFGIKEGDGMYLAPEERIYIFGPKS